MSWFKKQREKLKPKEVSLLKLVLWACSFVWMVMYFAFGLIMSQVAAGAVRNITGWFISGPLMAILLPIWIMFTVLLTIFLMGRWIYRKLK